MKHRIVLAIGGSSGALYAKVLLDKLTLLKNQIDDVGIVMSDNAKYNWELEIEGKSYKDYDFTIYAKKDFNAPFASGSAKYKTMIVCPCSMGVLGRISSGVSDDLTTRAADVILKERRKLILVPRETPLSLIHIDNMRTVTLAGGIICPAVPSFYSKPQTTEEVIATVVDRILDLAGLEIETYRWNS